MLRKKCSFLGLMALLLAIYLEASIANGEGNYCTPSSCGSIRNISYPFRLKGDPRRCGDHRYELECENNQSTLYYKSSKYYVKEIFYDTNLGAKRYGRIQVVDSSLDWDKCIVPHNPFLNTELCTDAYAWYASDGVCFLNCKVLVNSSRVVDVFPCNNISPFPQVNYALYGHLMASDFPEFCSIEVVVPAHFSDNVSDNLSMFEIYQQLLKGFQLAWYAEPSYCKSTFFLRLCMFLGIEEHRGQWNAFLKATGGLFLGRTLFGIVCLIAFVTYKFRRRHFSMYDAIEEFLQNQNNLMPIRYSYSEIKRMTAGFKDKLGQGGYGLVFKGKLRSGRIVAVKMLGKSKANGQDFINEVATIGRIHHVNVVQLIGFCIEGSKQALVYDFMPNGSLDKIIFSHGEKSITLSWKKMHEIALGVARGIEYLHRGCEMQILHFDIKPHNILLDENFTPKVSDFGLAKLCPLDHSVVSLTAARGTLGYIAPELFYKRIGGISYKADVYSFGMLLLEMAGRRKNFNSKAEQSSQMYFPSWIYDQFDQGEEMVLGDATENEKKIVKKMITIAFWCIQMKPIDRPSMNKVLEMLEGEVELLQMPPKPLVHSPEMYFKDHSPEMSIDDHLCTNSTEVSSLLRNAIDSVVLNVSSGGAISP